MRAFIRRRRFMAGIIENFMAALFACDALLPPGWARGWLVEGDGAGIGWSVGAGAAPGLAARAAGPLLPGIANVHSHAFQRAMAGLAEFRGHPTDDFWTWREEMYRLVQILTPEDVEAIARHLYIEMLRHGYTTVAEFHYMHNDRGGKPYADKAEMRSLAKTGATVGLCPMTEANLGDGIFEFQPWFEARRPWSIGGDSHVSVSPFEELRALEYSQRLRHRVRNVIADETLPDVAANLWLGAAAGGAQSTGQPAGGIAPGQRADLVRPDGPDAGFRGPARPAQR